MEVVLACDGKGCMPSLRRPGQASVLPRDCSPGWPLLGSQLVRAAAGVQQELNCAGVTGSLSQAGHPGPAGGCRRGPVMCSCCSSRDAAERWRIWNVGVLDKLESPVLLLARWNAAWQGATETGRGGEAVRLSLCCSQDEPSLVRMCLTGTSAVISSLWMSKICSHIVSPFMFSLLRCSAILITQRISTIKSHFSFGHKGNISLGSGDQEPMT